MILRAAGVVLVAAMVGGAVSACTDDGLATSLDRTSPDDKAPVNLGPGGDATLKPIDGGSRQDRSDGGPPGGDPSTRVDRYATHVVSFTPGACAGFGQDEMPAIVLGPPQGAGSSRGSLDVVSLGNGGEIVLSFEPNAIIDGPGIDLIVFENAFYTNGDTSKPYAEPAEVSVSDDGSHWTTFPCTAQALPYEGCAGSRPVFSSEASGISPLDPGKAGGDGFDFGSIGVFRARFVRIKDKTTQRCTSQGPDTNGFDLDAVAAVNAEDP